MILILIEGERCPIRGVYESVCHRGSREKIDLDELLPMCRVCSRGRQNHRSVWALAKGEGIEVSVRSRDIMPGYQNGELDALHLYFEDHYLKKS